jgi:preprotein translocase subunit SecD
MTRIKKTAGLVALAIIAAFAIYEAQKNSRLEKQVQALEQRQALMTEEIARLRSESASFSNQLQASGSGTTENQRRLRELLRLRGEVGILRSHERQLEQALASSPSSVSASQTKIAVPNTPAAFHLHLVSVDPTEETEAMTNNSSAETLRLQKTPIMDYTAIRLATASTDPLSGASSIDVEFNEEGKELFAAFTKENINRRLAIVLNGQVFSAPVIRSEIPGGRVQITGSFTQDEARLLAAKINDAVSRQ